MSIATNRRAEQRLEELVGRAERLRRRLPFDDIRELAALYRASSARLARLRTRGADPEAIRYLNALCVRAYTHLQVPTPRKRGFGRFFLSELPTTLGATAALQMLVLGLMLAGGAVGAMLASEDPAAIYACVPHGMYPPSALDRLVASASERREFLTHSAESFGVKSIFSAGLFVHNSRVGLLAFSSGILAGVPTLLLVFGNGVTIGAFAWIFSRDAAWPLFWAWLLPHAIPELLAVTLCSVAGLLLGAAVVAPGRVGTARALRAATRPALELVAAALPLLLVAAGLESFLRQSQLSTATRFAVAFASLAALAAYALRVRRLARRPRALDLGWLREAPPAGSPDSGSVPAP